MKTRFIANGRYRPITLTYVDDKILFDFAYCKPLIQEIKALEGAKWNPQEKQWSAKNSDRNAFAISYLQGNNPYEWYDLPIKKVEAYRSLMTHQKTALNHMITRKRCIYAGEMGVGKTLATIEAMEASGLKNWLWVAPKSALNSVRLEFLKWNSPITPHYSTYASLRKNWNRIKYDGVVFDECQRLKNPTSIRSQAAMMLANSIREKDGCIFLLSGTPAPKNPCDWWHLCELAQPGFLKEGNLNKLKYRLGKIVQDTGLAGQSYPKLVCWYDREGLCKHCGYIEKECLCDKFEEAENEVKKLGSRMTGLVIVHFKADCLDLPEKIYQTIKLEVSPVFKRLMSLVVNNTSRAAETLSKLRMLSDGFQYEETDTGQETTCPVCEGAKVVTEEWEADGIMQSEEMDCRFCSQTGKVRKMKRSTKFVGSPKQQALEDLLDEHRDIGRLVVWGGFQGSIDIIKQTVTKAEWDYIKVDGRGWENSLGIKDPMEMLKAFQNVEKDNKICFIGQPGSGGTGITLTASPTAVYYSNTFNAEDRMQSEDRIHRAGMDAKRGARIIDLIHLDTDELVLDNLKQKKDLQTMSMVKLKEYMEESNE